MFYCLLLSAFLAIISAANVPVPPDITLPLASANSDITRFQNALQQQTFQSILLSIEDRLRNLDKIYSMQFSEILQTKLDQYNRKLESLDRKIMRFESMIVLNLDKISENYSTRNYRDDLFVTQTYRKLDNVYDSLMQKMNYMDKKYEMAFEKTQNRIESILSRLDKLEENTSQRNADIDTEIADTQVVIDDIKTTLFSVENNFLNVTNTILNQTLKTTKLLEFINVSNTQSTTLEFIQNMTLKNFNISVNSQRFLTAFKQELKEDFNDYAVKVADMNADIWKRNDMVESRLKTIETLTNSTIIEVQNGIRALKIQLGKLHGKEILNSEKNSLETLKNDIESILEKILLNQGVFLESCHRVQMDESQIESEISLTMEKLLDVSEKKLSAVMKDLKSLKKATENHDSRMNTNLYQANKNMISLFDKTMKNHKIYEDELRDIKFYINSLSSLILDLTMNSKNDEIQHVNGTIDELQENIASLVQKINEKLISDKELKNNEIKNDKLHINKTADLPLIHLRNEEQSGIDNRNLDEDTEDIISIFRDENYTDERVENTTEYIDNTNIINNNNSKIILEKT